MTHQDKISLLITFFVGVVVGAYIYITGFVPTYRLPEIGTEQQYSNWVIIGESFGACEVDGNCLSFQVLQNGSFQGIIGGESVRQEFKGKVSGHTRQSLDKTLTDSVLSAFSKPKSETSCLYGDDATNFRFRITIEGKNYSFDTCHSDIDYNSTTWETLKTLWKEVAIASAK